VKLVNIDLRVKRFVVDGSSYFPASNMELSATANGGKEAAGGGGAAKRDMEAGGGEVGGPILKKSKPDEVIIVDSDRESEPPRIRAVGSGGPPSSPEITVIKLNSKTAASTAKENSGGERKSDVKSPSDSHWTSRTTTPDKMKPVSNESGKKQQDSSASKSSSKNGGNSSSSSSSGGGGAGSSNGATASGGQNTPMDRTDRTSLQCLEQKLKDLQQKHQQKAKNSENHAKPKSMSPSSGLKSSKDSSYHRRSESFIAERKKTLNSSSSSSSSPVKKTVKKSSVTPPPPSSHQRENKLGGLFCPTTDAKVTILPCKASPRDEVKPLSSSSSSSSSSSNSVTITKLSSGDTLSVPSKDIKKVFTAKSEMKSKVVTSLVGGGAKSDKFSFKSLTKVEKIGGGGDKSGYREQHRAPGGTSRDHSREKGSAERRERLSSLKIIRCSKCREVFSTKEAKKLHTCNSILDAHYLIDGGDRQKTSPTSSVSNSDRSESTSTSLSRSSSRSSSPGLPLTVVKRSSMMAAAVAAVSADGSGRLKLARKLEEERIKSGRSLESAEPNDEDDDKTVMGTTAFPALAKRDSMKEKWVETKGSAHHRTEEADKRVSSSGGLVIEAVKAVVAMGDGGEGGHKTVKSSSSIEILKMERDSRSKDDLPSDAALFAFSGKRTYSPSMSENTTEGKGSADFFSSIRNHIIRWDKSLNNLII
jgi:hypothetical protein